MSKGNSLLEETTAIVSSATKYVKEERRKYTEKTITRPRGTKECLRPLLRVNLGNIKHTRTQMVNKQVNEKATKFALHSYNQKKRHVAESLILKLTVALKGQKQSLMR